MNVVKTKSRKPFSHGDRRAVIELWKANVLHKAIREHLKMSKATLKRILAFARANPENPGHMPKPRSGLLSKFSTATATARRSPKRKGGPITAKMY
jgi:hypothetical protein